MKYLSRKKGAGSGSSRDLSGEKPAALCQAQSADPDLETPGNNLWFVADQETTQNLSTPRKSKKHPQRPSNLFCL